MTLRIGMLGCGFIARYHAGMLSLAEEPNVLGLVHDEDVERAERFAREHGARVAPDAAAVARDSDAVFVCTWTSAHREGVEAAVEAGVPVFCEKPLAPDLAGAAELVELVEGASLLNQVGLVLRSMPALVAARELLRSGAGGPVMNVVFRDDQYLPTQGVYGSTWRADAARAGSGVLLEHSIHDVDLLEWLLGPTVSVHALDQHLHGIEGIEDSVTAMLRFAGGATACLATVWHDVLSRPSQRRLEVFAQRALLTVEGEFVGPVRWQTSEGELVLDGDDLLAWLAERDVALPSAEQRFLEAVRAQRDGEPVEPPGPGLRDALRAHVVVDALYRSAQQGGAAVQLDEVT